MASEPVPCDQPGIPPREVLAKMNAGQLFDRLCAVCHQKDLSGGFGPSLLEGEWKHGSSDAEILHTIKEGNLELGMLPWKNTLTDEQIRSLVIFIREKERAALDKKIDFPKPSPGKPIHTEHHDYMLESLVGDGLESPSSLGFLPDGRLLVTELPGRLRIVNTDGTLDPRPVAGTPETARAGQAGLLAVAIHPEYEANGWVYLSFAHALKEGKDGTGTSKNAPSRMTFERGMLFFTVGDRGAWQHAQDLTCPHGKIFRLRDNGKVPSDNPGFEQPGALPGIWAFGFRDSRGLAVDPATGSLYCTDRGPRGGDELDWVRPGRNFGWPLVTHGMNPDGTPITAETHREGMESPIASWVPSIGAGGFTFYTGDKFPEWKHNLFLAALENRELRRLEIANHMVVGQEIILKAPGRVRDVAQGPDGFLYVLLDKPDALVRIVPAPAK